jgi:acid phosphatase
MRQSLYHSHRPVSAIAIRIFSAAIIAGLIAGCATAKSKSVPAPEPDPQPETERPIDEVFHEAIHWSRNSAEYRAIFEQTYRAAGQRIEELAEGWEPGSWAVSLDADETMIDNSSYQVEIGKRGEAYGPESWNAWVQERSAPALPGAVEFTQRVKALGGIVAGVTNRRDHQCAPTADNLRDVGIAFDVVLCRSGTGEKEPRWEALVKGTTAEWPGAQFNGDARLGPVTVLMWLGDNVGDFPDQDQQLRNSESPLADFGDRFFVLPNPMYGSWAGNPKD